MKAYSEQVLDSLVALEHPTVREMREYLAQNDPFFVGLPWPSMYWIVKKHGPARMGWFHVDVPFAKMRAYLARRPPWGEPAVRMWEDEKLDSLVRALENSPSPRFLTQGVELFRDETRPVWYVVRNDSLIGVFDGGRNTFRFPGIRARNEPSRRPNGEGWSETAYASFLRYGARDQFLRVSAC